MAAEILEQLEDTQNTDDIPRDEDKLSTDDLVANLSPEPTDNISQENTGEDDLPEKYRGKSIKEIISMHQSAEQLIGAQGSEVGELRKVVDGYIQTQLQTQQTQQPEPDPIDFFEDPEKAVSQAIEKHPDVVRAKEQATEMRRTSSMAQLQSKHPDMSEVLNNPNFAPWVQGSPVRMELFQRADKDFDFNAADELISNFKERSRMAQESVQTEATARQKAVKQASTGSSTGSSTAGSKRVYRRADIIKLMKTDPDRYEALNGEIMAAYREGRIK